MSEDDWWVDVSVWGSAYQQEYNQHTKQHRHRKIMLALSPRDQPSQMYGAWQPGEAPDKMVNRDKIVRQS